MAGVTCSSPRKKGHLAQRHYVALRVWIQKSSTASKCILCLLLGSAAAAVLYAPHAFAIAGLVRQGSSVGAVQAAPKVAGAQASTGAQHAHPDHTTYGTAHTEAAQHTSQALEEQQQSIVKRGMLRSQTRDQKRPMYDMSNETFEMTIGTSPAAGSAPAGSARDPIIVVGMEGSGTRSVQALLSNAGVWMGKIVSFDGDCADSSVLKPHISLVDIMDRTASTNYELPDLPPPLRTRTASLVAKMRERAVGNVAEYLAAHGRSLGPGSRWGWKGPRNMYFLPFLEAAWPRATVVYVLRDPRDLAKTGTSYGTYLWRYRRHEADDTREKAFRVAMAGLGAREWCSKPSRTVKCHFIRTEDVSGLAAFSSTNNVQNVQDFYDALELPAPAAGVEALASTVSQCLGSSKSQQCGGFGQWRSDPGMRATAQDLLTVEGVQEFMRTFGYSI